MDGLMILAVLFVLFLLAGGLLSFSNFSTIRQLRREIATLKNLVNLQSGQINRLNKQVGSGDEKSDTTETSQPQENAPVTTTPKTVLNAPTPVSAPVSVPASVSSPSLPSEKSTENSKESSPWDSGFDIEQFLRGNGLFWLGGLVLAIGGIFLARYAIEAGLLSPGLRVVLGGLFGTVLVGTAEYLSRYREKFHIYSPYVCAAIASGGIITCFAMALVAYDYYHFISAELGFALLAAIALIATWLALRFGPVLAWIGVIGAYIVPALVSTDSPNVAVLYAYILLVSASATWIAQSVCQSKIWWLSFAAHTLWMLWASAEADTSNFTAVIIFTLFTIYLFALSELVLSPLDKVMTETLPVKALLMPRKELPGIILPLIALCGYLSTINEPVYLIMSALIIGVVLCYLPNRYSLLDSWPFLGLLFQLFIFVRMPSPGDYSDIMFPFAQNYLFVQVTALAMLWYSTLMLKKWQRPAYLMLLVVAPVSLYAVSYALAPDEAAAVLYPVWAAELTLLAIGAALVSMRISAPLLKLTLTLLSNACITLCLTMLLNAGTLTLALAIQIGVMSYLSWKARVSLPDWVYKVALIAVSVRLTMAPWLDAYSGETVIGVRWTLIILPMVIALFGLSRFYQSSTSLRQWLDGGILHLTALFITTQTSYLLVGHYPDFTDLTFTESALLACNWLILSAVYLWRARFAQRLSRIYHCYAALLVAAAAVLHIGLSGYNNPFFVPIATGDGVFLNWLIVLWLLPALMLIGMGIALGMARLIPGQITKAACAVGGVLLFFYINGVIRGAFHPGNIVISNNVPQAELYTYSIVWLLIAVAIIFGGQHLQLITLRNAGFGILAVIILKAFIFDTAQLEGLYRAISFIGLGFSLVGIGWLYQKLSNENQTEGEHRVEV
ncbi:DUF2339 domain-containing protein [Alteromonas confluentis]|uniref:DUF2339 domain-containing protein n=1 Tax=Alteromonas confluentis TaxID=1656094 RepID=A0A1E7Z738_9ALTE|nr:DUF2339 domain-containing protein [Alteromonas confluentis]OFC69297.1 hypothetical protein BFC18_17895 [Alteromonas confluentis]